MNSRVLSPARLTVPQRILNWVAGGRLYPGGIGRGSRAQSGSRDPAAGPEHEADYKPLDWKVIRGILEWMRPYWRLYAWTTVVGFLVNFLEMITPRYMQQLIDTDIPGKAANLQASLAAAVLGYVHAPWGHELQQLSGHSLAYLNIALTIALWAVTMLLSLLLQRYGIATTCRIGENVLFALRKRVFNHLQALSMSYYDRTKFGRILTRGTSDIDSMYQTIVWGINTLIGNVLLMLIAAGILLLLDWRIGLAVLWLGPVLYVLNNVYRRRIGAAWRRSREGFTRVSTNLAENISGTRVVAAFNRQDENLEAFNNLQEMNTANNLQVAVINGVYQPLLGVIGFLGKVIILLFGSYLVLHTALHAAPHPFTVGKLVAAYIYWDWFMGPVINFGNFYNDSMMAMACAERVQALLALQPQVKDMADATVLPPLRGDVEFDRVNFSYSPDKPVLHDISFAVAAGQTVALVGHTGCGKSTIVSLICRFYQPQSGRILVDGRDIAAVTGESLHKQMGIVSQNNYLFSGTVLDNIRYARPQATRADVIEAARQLNSYEAIERLKNGFDTEVGERGGSLSLGQRQLICFTRAFLANPRILLLDEATSAVDTHTELLLQQAIEKLVANRTTFIVAHRLSTIVNANLVLVLDHGRIIERGSHRELLALNGRYAALYREFTQT